MRHYARSPEARLLAPRRRMQEHRPTEPVSDGSLISDLDAVLWEADPNTFQFTYVSAGAERLLGFPVQDWLGEQDFWARHIHPDDRAEAVTHCLHATREGRDHEFQYRMVASDGSTRLVRDFVRVHVDELMRPRRLFGVLIDITDHTDTEPTKINAARASQAPSRILILEDNPDDATLVERLIRKVIANCVVLIVTSGPEFDRALWEFAPDVILSDHKIPAFGGRDALRLTRARTPGTPFILITGSLDEETAVEYMKAGASDYVLKDRMARLGLTVLTALDQKRQREEHARAEAQFREMFLRAPVGIARTTVEGQLLTANPELARMLGYDTTVDLSELNLARDIYVNPSDRDRVIASAMGSGPASGVEVQWKKKDGSIAWVNLTVQSEQDASGQPRHIEVFARDVTEEQRLGAQLRHAQRMEAIGQLAGGVAHDFNNLLTVVLGSTDLVLSDLAPSDPIREDVATIRKAANHGAELTRQLLAFSRRQLLTPRAIAINSAVENVERMLLRLIGGNVELRVDLAPGAGSVLTDQGQVEQIIINLVINARDAIPADGTGVITIRTDVRRASGAEREQVVLSVSDTGVGMDEDVRARIFEPFFTTKEPGKGTGLGLSTVYGIVKQCGGELDVDSAPGKGTTVTVSLPTIDDAPAAMPAGSEPQVGTETILIVEDDREIRALAHRILSGAGYKILLAANGDEALTIANVYEGQIHLLLLDIVIPGMNGIELSKRFARNRIGTPVLYISGFPGSALGAEVLTSDDNFMLKPFSSDALKRKVRDILDASK